MDATVFLEDQNFKNLQKKYCNGSIIPFIGAGLSQPLGMPSWRALLDSAYSELVPYNRKLQQSQFQSLMEQHKYIEAASILQSHCDNFKEIISNIFAETAAEKSSWEDRDNNYKDLAWGRMFSCFLTTNYDDCLEYFLRESVHSSNLSDPNLNLQDVFHNKHIRHIIHMHGTYTDPNSIVLSSEDYTAYYKEDVFKGKFTALGITKSFLFLGFSLQDKKVRELVNIFADLFVADHYIVTSDKNITEGLSPRIHPIYISDNYIQDIRLLLRTLYRTPLLAKLCSCVDCKNPAYDNQYGEKSISEALICKINYSAKNKESTLTEILKNNCFLAEKINYFQLVAEGGMGKTVQLLRTSKELLEIGIPVYYIPLRELRELDIEEFIRCKILDFENSLWNETELLTESLSAPSLIILDGFNEIPLDDQEKVANNVTSLMRYHHIRFLLSGREMIGSLPLEKLEILKLQDADLQQYFSDTYLSFSKDLWEILKIPMMARLYKETEYYIENNIPVNHILNPFIWRKPCHTKADIIWNYFQCQYCGVITSAEKLARVAALEYAAGFIAWKMVCNYTFSITISSFDSLMEDAQEKFACHFTKTERFRNLTRVQKYNYDSQDIANILLCKLNLFVIDQESVSIDHQYFRDFLAALHLKNETKNYIIKSHAWNHGVIPKNIIDMFSEMCTKEELLAILEKQRDYNKENKITENNNFYAYNWLQAARKKDISFQNFNFSWHDLRCTCLAKDFDSLSPFSFDHCMLSKNTFLLEDHSDQITDCKWSPDGVRIATCSKDTTAKIWNSWTGVCEATAVQDSDIRCICWPTNEQLVFGTKNGDIVSWNRLHDTLATICNIGVVIEGVDIIRKNNTWYLLVLTAHGFLICDSEYHLLTVVPSSRPDPYLVTPDQKHLIVASWSDIEVYPIDDMLNGAVPKPQNYRTNCKEIRTLSLSGSSNTILISDDDGNIFEVCLAGLQAEDRSNYMNRLRKMDSTVYRLDWNPHNGIFAASTFHNISFWDRSFQHRLYTDDRLSGLAYWSPIRNRLMIKDDFGDEIDIIDFDEYEDSRQPRPVVHAEHYTEEMYSWSPSGKYLACASGHLIFIWDLEKNIMIKRFRHSEQIIGKVMWSSDSSAIYLYSQVRCSDSVWPSSITHTVFCIDLETQAKKRIAECKLHSWDHFNYHDAYFSFDQWSPNKSKLLFKHEDNLHILDFFSDSVVTLNIKHLSERRESSTILKWNETSDRIIGVCDHQKYLLWNVSNGNIIKQFNLNTEYIECFRRNPYRQESRTTFSFPKNDPTPSEVSGTYILDHFTNADTFIFAELRLKLAHTHEQQYNTTFSWPFLSYEVDGRKIHRLSLDGHHWIQNAAEEMRIYLHRDNKNIPILSLPLSKIFLSRINFISQNTVEIETAKSITRLHTDTMQQETYDKTLDHAYHYILSPYSDDVIALLQTKPTELKAFAHDHFVKDSPVKIINHITTFNLVNSTFYDVTVEDDALIEAIGNSGGIITSE